MSFLQILTLSIWPFCFYAIAYSATLELVTFDYGVPGDRFQNPITFGDSGEMYFVLKNTTDSVLADLTLQPNPGLCVESSQGKLKKSEVAGHEEFRIGPFNVALKEKCKRGDKAALLLTGTYKDSVQQLNNTWIEIPFLVHPFKVVHVSQTNMYVKIPDRTTVPIDFSISERFPIKGMSISVDITHPHIGDLHIEIANVTNNIKVSLHSRQGATKDNLKKTYGRGGTPIPDLIKFDDVSSQGDWKLLITDGARRDTGILNSFELKLYAY